MVTEQEEMITVREAARESGRTTETVRRWIWEGKLPARKLGNQLFVRRVDLDQMLLKIKASDVAGSTAALKESGLVRDCISRRLGGNLDVLAILDKSRESHP